MKKSFTLLLMIAVLTTVCAGCGNTTVTENKAAQTGKKTINDILAESQAEAASVAAETFQPVEYPELDYTADVDLTVLNSNMVYSTVYNMMTVPDDYIGKTVKASGVFDVYTDPDTGKFYFACIIADATACCSQGLEFVWKGEHSYPDDYPQVGTFITIGGEFETYEEKGATYCRLKDAEFAY